jgi:hypothetical protein
MNNKPLKSILQQRAEQIAPGSEIDLWPAIQKHFTSRHAVLQKRVGGSKMKGITQSTKVIAPVLLALVLLAALVAFTPQGGALANRIINFFTTTDQTTFPVPASQSPISSTDVQTYLLKLVPVQPSPSSAPTSDASNQSCDGAALLTYQCQIASAEAQAGFDAWEFPADPQGVTFTSVEVDSVQREIKISYEVIGGGGWIDLRQGVGEITDGVWGRVPIDAVETVLIGDIPGEYVEGMYTSDGSGEATWNPTAGSQRLRWQAGERWFSLEKHGDPHPVEYLVRDEMIALATSLVENPGQGNSQLRAEYLTSVAEAEALSGIDLMEPALLPEGFQFSFAQYDPQIHTVRMVFKLLTQSEETDLTIIATPLESASDAEQGYFAGEGDQSLSWVADDLYMTMLFTYSQSFNGRLDEARMTAIAESMR